jgi:hypothetical protein
VTAFRDSLLTYLISLPSDATPDAILAKLVLAGSQLELLKYSDAFFEVLICGGLLQPGGSYLDAAGDETKRSKIAILRTRGTGLGDADIGDEDQTEEGNKGDWKKEIRDLVDVLKRLIQRSVARFSVSRVACRTDEDRPIGTSTSRSLLMRTRFLA